jgi:hypothetical protein
MGPFMLINVCVEILNSDIEGIKKRCPALSLCWDLVALLNLCPPGLNLKKLSPSGISLKAGKFRLFPCVVRPDQPLFSCLFLVRLP